MYLTLKLLHVLAVVTFLGNVMTGLFWHAHAARTRDAHALAQTMDGLIRSNRLFTTPGVIGIVLTGLALAINGRIPLLRTSWTLWTIGLFAISGLVFMLRVAPLQRQLQQRAQAGAQSGVFDYPGYRALALRWEAWGSVALLAPLAGLALMVIKP